VLFTSALSLVLAVFAREVLFWFTEGDMEMVRIGIFSIRVQCLAMPFHAYAIVTNLLCAGIGKAKEAMLLSCARQGICFYPILFPAVYLLGVWGVAGIQGFADILAIVLAIPITIRVRKDISAREKEQLVLKGACENG